MSALVRLQLTEVEAELVRHLLQDRVCELGRRYPLAGSTLERQEIQRDQGIAIVALNKVMEATE